MASKSNRKAPGKKAPVAPFAPTKSKDPMAASPTNLTNPGRKKPLVGSPTNYLKG